MRKLVLFVVVLGILGLSGAARAEDREVRFHGLGPRVGVSIDPNQFVFGGHADFGDILPHTNLLFPVVEIGVGDNLTLTSLGSDVLFRFADRWGVWTPYLGGELAFIFYNFDKGGNETELGLSGIFGVEKGIGMSNRFAVELKFKVIDSPDLKLMAIWAFGH